MIAIVDYGMGNLKSVFHALEMVGGTPVICANPKDLKLAERIVLPGVGAFRDCVSGLTRTGFVEALHEEVRVRGKPILGICLGLQVMARKSYEGGEYSGLGWFDAEVTRLTPSDPALRVPHVGWNDVAFRAESPLFAGLPRSTDFYFVHSYHMRCASHADVEATCDYGGSVTAAVRRVNVAATQFHPEKSQDYGLRLLANFIRWNP